jgi:hypothetical protein
MPRAGLRCFLELLRVIILLVEFSDVLGFEA